MHDCMQLELGDFFTKIKSLANEIKMCRIYTSHVSCGSGEIVNGATGGSLSVFKDALCLCRGYDASRLRKRYPVRHHRTVLAVLTNGKSLY